MKKLFIILVMVTFVMSLTACTIQIGSGNDKPGVSISTGSTKSEDKKIEMQGISDVNLKINMGVGKLKLEGGTFNLMDGNFIYNVDSWKPVVDYNKSGTTANLSIEQPPVSNINSYSNTKYEWNLKFNKDAVFNIDANVGVGESSIDLTDINLKELNLQLGIGKSAVDISGNYKSDVDVDVKGGIGDSTIYVPKNMNVTIETNNGIGNTEIDGFSHNGSTYTNNQNSKYKMKVDVHCGIGRIAVKQK